MATANRRRVGELLRGLSEVLAPHPDGLHVNEAVRRLREALGVGPDEALKGNRTNLRRRVSFDSIVLVKAGWMIRGGGTWSLTDAGREALVRFSDPLEYFEEGSRLYREWKRSRPEEEQRRRISRPVRRTSVAIEPPGFPSELPDRKKGSSRQFQTNPWKLSELLHLLDRGKIVLPEFQRSFIWRPADIDLLLTSLLQNYPAGNLLLLRANPTSPLAWRPVEGVELQAQGLEPDYLVLDGQQRLTSLSLALNGRGDPLFFIDLSRLAHEDLEAAVFPRRRQEAERAGLLDRETQWSLGVYPVWALFGEQADAFWLADYVEFHAGRGGEREQLKSRWRFLEENYLMSLRDYQFPVVELPADTDLEAVCQIFETLNKTGVKLTVFDLLTARFWPHGLHLRDALAAAREQYPILGEGEFNVDPTFFLQAISLLRSGVCKRGDLLSLEREGFEADWAEVCAGAADALSALREECGVLTRRWLPYAALFPALFAAAADIRAMAGPLKAGSWEKVKQWFWCAAFGQRYEGPGNTLNATDYRELISWFEDDDRVPEAVASFVLHQVDLQSVELQRSAVYRGVVCLTVVNGARDFHTGNRLTADSLKSTTRRIEDHHVFPSGYLNRLDPPRSPEHSILNKCLIDHETNQLISANPPSVYLRDMQQRQGVDKLEGILQSHLIPVAPPSAILGDDLDAFLRQRERVLLAAIAGVTGASIPEDAVDAYLDPARPFTNELALRKVLRSLEGSVFWYEQHMSRKALELLIEDVDRTKVQDIRLLSGGANVTDKTEQAFERFKEEMANAGIKAEWRILPDETARSLHARVVFDEEETWELPPLNSLLKGTVDSIRRSGIDRRAFVSAWDEPSAAQLPRK